MTTNGRWRRFAASLLALAVGAVGAACNDDDDTADRRLLELRPVVATNPAPCPAKAPEKNELVRPLTIDGKTECLELGRPIVDAKDVRSATVAETPAKEPALSVVLGGAGSANLDGFAQRNQGQRLAIVADGTLVSAPVVQFTSFAGRIQVTGLSKEKTEDLFRRLNKLIKRS
jgi:preprotein translocase subunit SecD